MTCEANAASTMAFCVALVPGNIGRLFLKVLIRLTAFIEFNSGRDRLRFVKIHAFDDLEFLRIRPQRLSFANVLFRLSETLQAHIYERTVIVGTPVSFISFNHPVAVFQRGLRLVDQQETGTQIGVRNLLFAAALRNS